MNQATRTKKTTKYHERFHELYKRIAPENTLLFAGSLLQEAYKRWPERIALIGPETKVTYKELYEHAARITRYLQRRGIEPGDRVMLLWQNSTEFYSAYFGIWQTGAVIAPVNTLLHEQEISGIIMDAQPTAIIVSDELAPKIVSAQGSILITETELVQVINTHEVPEQLTIPKRDPEELAALLYTSGTTGKPKGVMLSSKNILTNTVQGAALLEIYDNDRALAVLPLFHSFTQNSCVWAPMLVGATVIVVPKIQRRAIINGLQHRPTIILGIPALYGLFCLLKNLPLAQVRYFISGGDALPDKIRALFGLIYRRKLCNGYGLTEASPFISIDLDDVLEPTNTIGTPAYGIEVFIKDEKENDLPQGSIGTLWVKGDNVMLGYYNAPEATQKILKNGILNTGDLAYIDPNGKIVIVGRQKELIINKGINIYPQEIENILLTHPAVTQAAVIGIKEDTVNEIPIAFVAASKPSEALEQELMDLCKRKLASYKQPRKIIIKTELPTTATGKVDKKLLKL